MNEQIRGLAEQAADYANTYSDAGADVWFEIYNKKFAELIIRECGDIADEHNDYSEGVTLGVGRALKKHFGVEL